MTKEGSGSEIKALRRVQLPPDYVIQEAYKVGSPHRYEAESFEVHLRPVWDAEVKVGYALQALQTPTSPRLMHLQRERDYLKAQLCRREDRVTELEIELARRRHQSVKRFSAVGILSLVFCLALNGLTGVLVVNPLFSIFGILAFAVFGLMAVVDERRSGGSPW